MNIRDPRLFLRHQSPLRKTNWRFVVWITVGFGVLTWLVLLSFVVTPQSGEQQVQKPPRLQHLLPKPAPKPFAFPAGGSTLIPGYRFVALYGSPDMPALGSLGEQPLPDTIARVQGLAAQYQSVTSDHVYPTLEIIATIASAQPTDNGDYSQELAIAKLQPWIDAARQAGVYVVLDLQPGRSDFLSQAKQYELLLLQPNVGLALDPEWRLGPDQVHLQQIGSVGVDEVNSVINWLVPLMQAHHLPQKMFLLHQFELAMIQGREQLDTSHTELAYIIQMDGNGSQQAKQDSWHTIMQGAPTNVNFGWKNSYREDPVMLDPAGTMAITPQPWYVSYQ
jgi:hypothetical protein